jgi:hypothetical protein
MACFFLFIYMSCNCQFYSTYVNMFNYSVPMSVANLAYDFAVRLANKGRD